jgi:2-keto-3-deoxy-L-rhamnonate aldolase RhmA
MRIDCPRTIHRFPIAGKSQSERLSGAWKMSFGEDFTLTLLTNDPLIAASADAASVDRIGIDLDRLGKRQRQSEAYRISQHQPLDLLRIRPVIRRARLFARTDPLHAQSRAQINHLLELGAEVLMLPMFTRADEAATFIDLVGGRAQVSLLVETAEAAICIKDIVRLHGIDEIFVGLNDLQLSLKARSRFEVLASGLIDMIAEAVHAGGISFGIGGLGRPGDMNLPVPSPLIYAQYPRLAATFRSEPPHADVLAADVRKARSELQFWADAAPREWSLARDKLREAAITSAARLRAA